MTIYHIAQSQYRDQSNGTIEGVRVYFESLSYPEPTSIDTALADYRQRHAESDDAKEGWKLIGVSRFIMIDPELFKSYEGFVDNGVVILKKDVETMHKKTHLHVVK